MAICYSLLACNWLQNEWSIIDLEWPWVPISCENPFSASKAVNALTFALARLSCQLIVCLNTKLPTYPLSPLTCWPPFPLHCRLRPAMWHILSDFCRCKNSSLLCVWLQRTAVRWVHGWTLKMAVQVHAAAAALTRLLQHGWGNASGPRTPTTKSWCISLFILSLEWMNTYIYIAN